MSYPDVTFVGLAAHDTDERIRAFVDEIGLHNMLTVVDDDNALWARFGIRVQPAWVFVDGDGTIDIVVGALHGDALEQRLEGLLP